VTKSASLLRHAALYGMTLRRLLGQRRRDGKAALSENHPGPLSAPHINGVKNNDK
jgi:hypothetical protein